MLTSLLQWWRFGPVRAFVRSSIARSCWASWYKAGCYVSSVLFPYIGSSGSWLGTPHPTDGDDIDWWYLCRCINISNINWWYSCRYKNNPCMHVYVNTTETFLNRINNQYPETLITFLSIRCWHIDGVDPQQSSFSFYFLTPMFPFLHCCKVTK